MTATLGDPRLPDLFWAKVEVGPTPEHRPDLGPCWVWTRAANGRGYGQFGVNGVSKSVHRLSYTALVGPIPDGLTIDHLCRVKRCVRPTHLEAVTQAVNNRRKPASLVTECPKGHPYDDANTLRSTAGTRSCRECANARTRVADADRRRAIKPTDRRLTANRRKAAA